MKFIVLDCDYNFNKLNEPVVRLYGKTLDDTKNEDIVLHVLGIEPYIYLGNCGLKIFELQKQIEVVAKGFIKRIEIVQRFLPIGYQIEKSNILRIVLFNPKVVPDLRKLLKEKIPEVSDTYFYEADVPFKNRAMIDMGIDGTDVIYFNEKGKELQNYGVNCNKLFICDKSEIKVLKDEMVKIEY